MDALKNDRGIDDTLLGNRDNDTTVGSDVVVIIVGIVFSLSLLLLGDDDDGVIAFFFLIFPYNRNRYGCNNNKYNHNYYTNTKLVSIITSL